MEISSGLNTRKMGALASVLLAGTSAVTAAAQSAAPASATLQQVLAAARARVEHTDVRASGRLVQVLPDGTRSNGTVTFKAHWFEDGLHLLVEAGKPGAVKTRFLLTVDPTGHTGIESAAGEAAPVRLPQERWGDGVLGTNFAYEDFGEEQFLWSKQTLLPAAKYGARDCFVLKSEPGPGEHSHYASVTTWLDQKTGAPVHVERASQGPGSVKQFIFYDLQQVDGVWAARQVEAKREGQPGSSLLILENGSARAHLQRKDFSLVPQKR